MIVLLLFLLFAAQPLWSLFTPEEYLRRIHAHLMIEDPKSALVEAKEAFHLFPESPSLHRAYILALARAEHFTDAMAMYDTLDEESLPLLEEISWSILEKGQKSPQYSIRLHALIGAYFAQDRKSVKMISGTLQDTNAILRSIAIQLASQCRDSVLQKQLEQLLYTEKNWLVRSQLIAAVGEMRIKSALPYLEELLDSRTSTFEEKELAMKSLAQIHENIDEKKLQSLASSRKALIRQLACVFAEKSKDAEVASVVFPLLQDANAAVRIAAIRALLALQEVSCSVAEAKNRLEPLLNDVDPAVAITGAWAVTLLDKKRGLPYLEEALLSSSKIKRHLASAAIAALGDRGLGLAKRYLSGSFDPYVRLHLALCLIGQRQSLPAATEALYTFFMNKTDLLQYGQYGNTPFFLFQTSDVPFLPQIPNYPVVIDEVAQLKLLSYLAILQESRAHQAVEKFLKKTTWGISGLASRLLIQEGGEDSSELIAELLSSKDSSIQLQAALILAYLSKDPRAESVLKELYFTESHQHKKQILEALGQIAKPSSASFFLQALHEPFEILRILAASGLIRSIRR